MSIVSLSARKIHDLSKQNEKVGPGTYINISNNQIQKSYAPFNSTATKLDHGNSTLHAPGPGTYNISKNFVSRSPEGLLLSNQDHELKLTEISNNTYQFKSNIRRFEDEKKKTNTPGPGAYDHINKNINRSFRKAGSADQKRKPYRLEKIFYQSNGKNINLNIGFGPNEYIPALGNQNI
jgi:hypothetical protein